MTDKPRREHLEMPFGHVVDDATPGKWKFRCASCGNKSAESPSMVCESCHGEMERIVEEGGVVEAHK